MTIATTPGTRGSELTTPFRMASPAAFNCVFIVFLPDVNASCLKPIHRDDRLTGGPAAPVGQSSAAGPRTRRPQALLYCIANPW